MINQIAKLKSINKTKFTTIKRLEHLTNCIYMYLYLYLLLYFLFYLSLYRLLNISIYTVYIYNNKLQRVQKYYYKYTHRAIDGISSGSVDSVTRLLLLLLLLPTPSTLYQVPRHDIRSFAFRDINGLLCSALLPLPLI